jgi:hypothetical protein
MVMPKSRLGQRLDIAKRIGLAPVDPGGVLGDDPLRELLARA